jgi:hypothetical protein
MSEKAWYQNHLRCLGLGLMVVGFGFFGLVFPLGAPAIPWAGLVLALLGAWVGFAKPAQPKLVKNEKAD